VRAVLFKEVGKVSVGEVDEPRLRDPREAVVKVTMSAICGSDLHFLYGKAPLRPGEGMGHEAIGVVESVGPGVARFSPGDRVVIAFNIVCGSCWFCIRGQTSLCEDFRNLGAGAFGGGMPGAQAEKVLVPVADTNLLAIPDDVDDERALFVGDVLTTGYYAASLAQAGPDDVVAVVGCGPVGFFCAQAALALGAGRVFALDTRADRLALTAAAGATPVNVGERNPVMALSEATGGRGADVVIEAVGTPAAYEGAVDVVRRGGRIVVVGMYAGETTELQLGVYWSRALDIVFAGVCPVHAYWERAMQQVREGRIDPLPIISHRLPLKDAQAGYEMFADQSATKVILIP
jgi:threonine dehydrogenase-like Zn-dependent dehydrogenase